ncbi:hypothetical protein VTK56DRAFT_3362 [Thermocarpiscus australiensis]
MGNLIFFETTDSVIEILWDIALAVFVIRLALVYAALTYGSALAGLLLLPGLLPHPPPPPPAAAAAAAAAETTLLPPLLLLASSALWARYAIVRHEVPRVLSLRLAVGVTAAVCVLATEALAGLVLYETGWTGVAGWARMGWGTWMGVTGAFALMPAVLMGFESGGISEGAPEDGHGHEKRRAADVKVSGLLVDVVFGVGALTCVRIT